VGLHRHAYVALLAAGCGGHAAKPDPADADVDAAPLGAFAAPVAIAELNTAAAEEDPTLTADQLEIFFVSDRAGGAGLADIWTSTRASTTATWSVPSPVVQLNSVMTENHPHVSLDGLSMYLASDRVGTVGGLDIWFSTRATREAPWTAPVRVAELSSTSNDFSAAPDSSDLIVVVDSDRGGTTMKDLYLSTRTSEAALWRGPAGIAAVNTANNDQDGVFADAGKALYFATGVGAGNDLMVAVRASTSGAFGAPMPITELNTTSSELDPWVSEDQRTMVFNSDRAGTEDLYLTTR
jgi:Tol biopolymer transport system component